MLGYKKVLYEQTLVLALLLIPINVAQAGLFSKKSDKQSVQTEQYQKQIYEQLPPAARTASYSATRTMRSQGFEMSSKIYHSGLKERTETSTHGMHMVTIVRPDRDLIWQLMASTQQYMELPLSGMDGDTSNASAMQFTLEKRETETIRGHRATRYHVPETTDGKNTWRADYWITSQGVPIEMVISVKQKRKWQDITMSLNDVQVGPQAAGLFEVPAGYTRMENPLQGGGFFGEVGDEAKQGAEQGTKEATRQTMREKTRRKTRKLLEKIWD